MECLKGRNCRPHTWRQGFGRQSGGSGKSQAQPQKLIWKKKNLILSEQRNANRKKQIVLWSMRSCLGAPTFWQELFNLHVTIEEKLLLWHHMWSLSRGPFIHWGKRKAAVAVFIQSCYSLYVMAFIFLPLPPLLKCRWLLGVNQKGLIQPQISKKAPYEWISGSDWARLCFLGGGRWGEGLLYIVCLSLLRWLLGNKIFRCDLSLYLLFWGVWILEMRKKEGRQRM